MSLAGVRTRSGTLIARPGQDVPFERRRDYITGILAAMLYLVKDLYRQNETGHQTTLLSLHSKPDSRLSGQGDNGLCWI